MSWLLAALGIYAGSKALEATGNRIAYKSYDKEKKAIIQKYRVDGYSDKCTCVITSMNPR